MKTAIATACIVLGAMLSTSAFAESQRTSDSATRGNDGAAAQMADGLVRRVDRAAGRVIIAHGPLVNIGMPPMTMAFRVKEAVWLEQMKDGDRIRFVADNVDGRLTVVRFDKAR